jgi:hypothetical protein
VSNSYANAADGDAYHEGHLYTTSWTGASTANKEKALVMASRVIDSLFRFNGYKRMFTQALQWPRRECRDPVPQSGIVPGLLLIRGPCLDETKVPAVVVAAACEMARELLQGDRTGELIAGARACWSASSPLEIELPMDRAWAWAFSRSANVFMVRLPLAK